MKISGGIEEEGVVVGNAYDKYGSSNPVVKHIMRGFHDALDELVSISQPDSIHEIGCGEGFWVAHWINQGLAARGSDFSEQVIEIARNNALDHGIAQSNFSQKSIYDLKAEADGADLIVCCEVLEHLENPEEALEVLKKIVHGHLLVSVPREPLWRLLNMVRGRYLGSAGNTPGHIQHWSRNSFIDMVQDYFDVAETRSPLPWTMLLCRPK